MFVIAAGLFTLRSTWVVVIGVAAALAGAGIAWWGLERRLDGHDTAWLFQPEGRSPRALLFDVFVNGTHPLFPWLAFFCAGIVLGRLLSTDWWRPAALAAGFTLFGLASMISGAIGTGPARGVLASTDPFDRGLLYTASALGTALVAFAAISWLAERFVHTVPVERAAPRRGDDASRSTSPTASSSTSSSTGSDGSSRAGSAAPSPSPPPTGRSRSPRPWWWHDRYGIGPAEWLYRQIGG